MADALQVFKEALIAKKATDAAAAVEADAKIQRGQRVNALTAAFEATVGNIVETVSLASAELEGSAGTLRFERGSLAKARHGCCRGVGRGIDQCAVGGIGDRGNDVIGDRDQPPGAGVRPHRR